MVADAYELTRTEVELAKDREAIPLLGNVGLLVERYTLYLSPIRDLDAARVAKLIRSGGTSLPFDRLSGIGTAYSRLGSVRARREIEGRSRGQPDCAGAAGGGLGHRALRRRGIDPYLVYARPSGQEASAPRTSWRST